MNSWVIWRYLHTNILYILLSVSRIRCSKNSKKCYCCRLYRMIFTHNWLIIMPEFKCVCHNSSEMNLKRCMCFIYLFFQYFFYASASKHRILLVISKWRWSDTRVFRMSGSKVTTLIFQVKILHLYGLHLMFNWHSNPVHSNKIIKSKYKKKTLTAQCTYNSNENAWMNVVNAVGTLFFFSFKQRMLGKSKRPKTSTYTFAAILN